jgi:hypothetical protein
MILSSDVAHDSPNQTVLFTFPELAAIVLFGRPIAPPALNVDHTYTNNKIINQCSVHKSSKKEFCF